MLTITERQANVLAHAMFESWMVRHLAEFFAEETAGLSVASVRSRIRDAVQRARGHGFVSESQWCRYVDLSFILGPEFDRDPNLPWASEILADKRLTDPEMRIDLLYGAAQDHIALAEVHE